MPPKSKIEQLPAEIQDLVNQLIRNGKSIDTITAKLKELDVEVSRSSVGRYAKSFNEVMDRYKEIEHFAGIFGSSFEDKSHGEIARANSLLVQGSLFKLMTGDGEKEITLDPKEAMQLARTLESLAKASKLDTDREMKIRADAEKRAKEEAAKAVDKVAKIQGLSKDTVSAIKSQILGVQ